MSNNVTSFLSSLGFRSRLIIPVVLLSTVVLATSGFLFVSQRKLSKFQEDTTVSYQRSSTLEELLADVVANETLLISQIWASGFSYDKGKPVTDTWVSDDLKGILVKLEDALKKHQDFAKNDTEQSEINGKLFESLATLKGRTDTLFGQLKAGTVERAQLFELLGQIRDTGSRFQDLSTGLLTTVRSKSSQESEIKSTQSKKLLHMAELSLQFQVLLALILSAVVFTVVVRGAKTLALIAKTLATSSNQVSLMSGQISTSAQNLSATSSEQASAVEQTSASLQEMSGIVDNNVRNAEKGLEGVNSVISNTQEGNDAMTDLKQSITDILESNKMIEKLVKVIEEIGDKTAIIDEIVFQTKLLSFNASVEAERAGEHGRGFAVVAQEVGNLAQMSGKAALEISSIVKTSTKDAQEIANENRKKVELGGTFVENTAKILANIEKGAKNLHESSSHIVTASKEQSSGIRQINTAMDNVNKTTQETASTSEETAGAGEQLSTQAKNLDSLVAKLIQFVDGASGNGNSKRHSIDRGTRHNDTFIPQHSAKQAAVTAEENQVITPEDSKRSSKKLAA